MVFQQPARVLRYYELSRARRFEPHHSPYMSLLTAFQLDTVVASLLDTFVFVLCTVFLYKHARLTTAHPGFMYLIFHAMFFSARMYSVMRGSPTLFSNWPGTLPVSDQEIAHAVLLADAALISMTVGLILSSQRDRRNATRSFARGKPNPAMLSARVVHWVSMVAFPVGVVSLLVNGAVPNVSTTTIDFGIWGTSSWLVITQFWPVLVLLALIYYYGFRPPLVGIMIGFLLLMSIQGYDRFRVILPVIFTLITWQTRTGSKWPRKWMIVSLVSLAILTFPMKRIGRMVLRGETISEIVDIAKDSISEAMSVTAPDQMFLDMFAATMWLVDEYGHYFYGTTTLSLIYLPIPRQWWPEKPDLSNYLYETRNPMRPIYWAGMGGNILGEAYANFGSIGVAAVPFFVGYLLGKVYFAAMRKPYFSVYRFMYVIVASCLVQVYRDGLNAIVIFHVVDMMQLVAIAMLSYVSFRNTQTWSGLRPQMSSGHATGVTQGYLN